SAVTPVARSCANDETEKNSAVAEATIHRFKCISSPFCWWCALSPYGARELRSEEGEISRKGPARRRVVSVSARRPERVRQGRGLELWVQRCERNSRNNRHPGLKSR